jgi:hypothetical protein
VAASCRGVGSGILGERRGQRRGARRTFLFPFAAASNSPVKVLRNGGASSSQTASPVTTSPWFPSGRWPGFSAFFFLDTPSPPVLYASPTSSLPHTSPHPRDFPAPPRRFSFSSSPSSYTLTSTHARVSSRIDAPLLHFPLPVGGVPDFLWKREPLPDQSRRGTSLRPLIGAEPAFLLRGMLAHFPDAFAGGRFSPSSRPSAWTFPLGGVGGVVMLPFP